MKLTLQPWLEFVLNIGDHVEQYREQNHHKCKEHTSGNYKWFRLFSVLLLGLQFHDSKSTVIHINESRECRDWNIS